jgi:UDP-glucuronate 4-epimerase
VVGTVMLDLRGYPGRPGGTAVGDGGVVNVLVTGGAGFIGYHVASALIGRGDGVVVLDDLNDFYDPAIKRQNLADLTALGGALDVVEGDVTQPDEVAEAFARGIDRVIHLAARAGVRPSLDQPALYQRVNVEGTANVLEAARRHDVGKVVLASSSSVYGTNAKVPFAEEDPIFNAISPYAASKLATESLGHVWHHLYGIDVVALRFFTAYGPRQRPDLAIHRFARLMLEGRPIPVFGDGSSARDYTYVSDIADGVLAALDRPLGYEIINLGGSRTVRLDQLVRMLEGALGVRAVLDRQPPQPGDVPITYADPAKARRLLGFAPRVPIAEGLERFAAWLSESQQQLAVA